MLTDMKLALELIEPVRLERVRRPALLELPWLWLLEDEPDMQMARSSACPLLL